MIDNAYVTWTGCSACFTHPHRKSTVSRLSSTLLAMAAAAGCAVSPPDFMVRSLSHRKSVCRRRHVAALYTFAGDLACLCP